MRRWFAWFAAAMLLFGTIAAPAFGQSRNTGGIKGTVTDETGGRIPGVLVQAESPDMIGGSRAVTTDSAGTYRFPDLPPGAYTLTFSIDGYQTVKHEGLAIQASRIFDLDVQLTPRAGEETIVVSGQTPLVDVTSSSTQTIFSESYLQNLPTGRFQPETLNLAPGIEFDSAYGGGGSSANAYQIDGVDVSDPEGGTPWSFFNYNIIKEVQLIGLGAPAEYGGFTGVLFNSVTKSGGNEFSGLAEANFIPTGLVGTNTDDPSLEPPAVERAYDLTFQAGGPFKKDKLWYFVSAQYLRDESSQGGPVITEKDPRLFAKLTWQANPDNQFEFWAEWDRYDITGRDGSAFVPLEATVTEDAPEVVWNLSWRRVLNPNATLNVAYTGYTGYFYLDPASGYDTRGRINEQGFSSDNSTYYYLADRYRHQMVASVTQYSDRFLTGKHQFKYGAELERSRVRSRAGIPGDAYYYDYYGDTYAYTGYYTYDQRAINHRASVFAQDTWQINDRVTVNPGVRLDFNRGSVPGSGNLFRTQPIAPRLGITFDLTGKHKTVLKAHYGRYYEALFGNFYQQLGPEASSAQATYLIDPGTPFDPDNPDPAHTLIASRPERKIEIDRRLKHPRVDQWILGLDHDLGRDFALQATLVYRKNKDFIESVFRKQDFEKVAGVDADTGRILPLFNEIDPDQTVLEVTNPEGIEREYAAVILTATKRLTNRWQMQASYVRSHSTGNIDNIDFSFSDLVGSNYGPSPYLDTPNSLLNNEGDLTNDLRDEVTLQGQYIIPKIEVSVSGDYRYVSGRTWTPQGVSVEYLADPNDPMSVTPYNQGRVRFFAEPRGSRRLDPTNQFNMRVEKFFTFGGGTRFGVLADVFNVFNKGEDIEVQERVGPTLGDASRLNLPRIWRLLIRYEW